MTRRLLNLLTILSLLLCVGVGVLWFRSARRVDTLKVDLGEHCAGFTSAGGDVSFFFNSRRPNVPWWETRPITSSPYGGIGMAATLQHYALGFGFQHVVRGKEVYRNVACPHWLLLLALLAPPVLRLRRTLRVRKLRRSGGCQMCGYDLCATPDRCPECGHVNAAAATSAADSR
jgi:hypothetical protein